MKNTPFVIHPSPSSRRDAHALERRRLKAALFFNKGRSQAEVAQSLAVSRAAVHYWYIMWKKKKKDGLKSKGRPGPRSKLTPEKIKKVKMVILKGAAAAGYDTDLWTLSRIQKTIQKTVRVAIGQTHTWSVIHSLGFTCQKPETRYRDRDEAAIKRWKQDTWVRIQKRGLKLKRV